MKFWESCDTGWVREAETTIQKWLRGFYPYGQQAHGTRHHLGFDGGFLVVVNALSLDGQTRVYDINPDVPRLVWETAAFGGGTVPPTVVCAPATYYEPTSPLRAISHEELPGDTRAIQAELDRIPNRRAEEIASAGWRIKVFGGTAVTDLQAYKHLIGVPTGIPGDGGRTWDQVPSTASNPILIAAGASVYTMHEVGHALREVVPAPDINEWLQLYPTIPKTSLRPYEQTEKECWASSCERQWHGTPQPHFKLTGFFKRYA